MAIEAPSPLFLQHNCREPAPVKAFATQARTPIAKEPLLIDDRVVWDGLHSNDPDSHEAVRDIPSEIEQKSASGPRRREKADVSRVFRDKALRKLRPDLIGGLSNARADRCTDTTTAGAELGHPGDGGIDNAAQRAAPSAMCRADNAGDWIIKQDRRSPPRHVVREGMRQRLTRRQQCGHGCDRPPMLQENKRGNHKSIAQVTSRPTKQKTTNRIR